jgi:hypothetical protein
MFRRKKLSSANATKSGRIKKQMGIERKKLFVALSAIDTAESSLISSAGVYLDFALGQGGVGDLLGEDLDGGGRASRRGGEADKAGGRLDPVAAHLGGPLDLEHALVAGRVPPVVYRPRGPLPQARDAHHAACTHIGWPCWMFYHVC